MAGLRIILFDATIYAVLIIVCSIAMIFACLNEIIKFIGLNILDRESDTSAYMRHLKKRGHQ